MKRISTILFLIIAVYVAYTQHDLMPQLGEPTANSRPGNQPLAARPISEQKSGTQVEGSGTVISVLSDDNNGSRHQRFILKLDSGATLLIAHNIDVAPRIDSLRKGDTVDFYGVFEANAKGGLIHWTHRDTRGDHIAGWLKHEGRTYQ